MISILIPIYNYDVRQLAETLATQCKTSNQAYEIVCYDDCSQDQYRKTNRKLDDLLGVSYVELSENLGRAKIRNWLAKNARYDHLIFIDCDSKIDNEKFVQNYLDQLHLAPVIYGGRVYEPKKPSDPDRIFHWTYGTKRESQPVAERKKFPYRSFQTNNFLINRDLMLAHPFDETIRTYGYEDLLMAEILKKKKIAIVHIENTLIHKGLERTEDFLAKSKDAAENLAILYHNGLLTNTKNDSLP